MTDDDLTNIPPMIPDRDEVDSFQRARRQQGQDIVTPRYYTEKVRVSTWPTRLMLTLLTLSIIGVGVAGYFAYQVYREDLRQAELRISDLEGRLALVGDSSEESTLNMIERLDFNFSEIDKLWAARRSINTSIDEIKSEVARVNQANTGLNETIANNSQLLATANETVLSSASQVNTLTTQLEEVAESVGTLNTSMAGLQSLRTEMESLRGSISSGGAASTDVMERLLYLEESLESVNANRLQVNAELLRFRQDIETLQLAR